MSSLRSKLQKLARDNPALERDLRPLIKTASGKKDFKWAADELENVLQMLEDVADVMGHRPRNEPSLADDYREVADLLTFLQSISSTLDHHQKAMEKLAR